MKKAIQYVVILLFCGFAIESATADGNQYDTQFVKYYIIVSEIGDYSGTVTLLKTNRDLTPNEYTIYSIRDDVDKDMWLAMTDYFDWAVFAYFYKDETIDTAKRISFEQFQNYIKEINF